MAAVHAEAAAPVDAARAIVVSDRDSDTSDSRQLVTEAVDEYDEADEASPSRVRQLRDLSTTGLFVLAVFYTMYMAQAIIVPLVLAVIIKLLLAPVVFWLRRHAGVPYPLGAALVLFGLIGLLVSGGLRLVEPARNLVQNAPRHARVLQDKLTKLKEPLIQLERASGSVQELTGGQVKPGVQRVVQQPPMGVRVLLDQGAQVAVGMLLVVMLSYFLLASGQAFLSKLVRVLPTFDQKRRAVETVHQIEAEVSRYLLAITAINIGLGCVVGVGLWLVGMPDPLLWGTLVVLLNYVPYVGPMVGILLVGLVSMVTFEGTVAMLLPPGVYLAANTLEAYLVTPLALGRSLSLSAVVVLASVVVWTWLWGILGAILAVPLLVIIKIVCSNVRPWSAIATFLEAPSRT